MTEREMRPTVEAWLRTRGMTTVLHESVIFGNADLVGVCFAERTGQAIPQLEKVIVVELKIRDTAGVLQQARIHREYPVQSYAAMPAERTVRMRRATIERFKDFGVGLLAVCDCCYVEQIVPPLESATTWGTIPKRLWQRVCEVDKAIRTLTKEK